VSPTAAADLFGPGGAALALARAAFGGRGFFTPVRRQRPDGSWLGPEDAIDLAARALLSVPYTYGEPEQARRQRLAELAARLGAPGKLTPEDTENTEKERVRIRNPETPSLPASVSSVSSVVKTFAGSPEETGIVPTPVGEPQGLDTVAFFTACRLAWPQAHIVVDLELLGLKLGQLCLSFGADEIVGSILPRRELRLGARAGSCELDRGEAAQLLRAAGFVPYERLPDGKVRAS
jgi:hypothetical protein